jgi:serine/threonine protein phosphatase PrpC
MPTLRQPALPNGRVAAYHDNACHGEDAYVSRGLRADAALDAVLDGATGSGGRFASQHVAELLRSAPVAGFSDILSLLEAANQALFRRGRGRFFLTTLSLALKLGDALHAVIIGDSPMFLVRDGEVVSLTAAPTGALHVGMSHLLGQHERLRYKARELALREGDWLIIASDGLLQNVAPRELIPLLHAAATPQEAVAALSTLLGDKRRHNRGRVDDHTGFLQDDVTAVFRYFEPRPQRTAS